VHTPGPTYSHCVSKARIFDLDCQVQYLRFARSNLLFSLPKVLLETH
jgi:hypothetical protein